jgi:hypothetical protein
MSRINTIEEKLRQLEQGKFQKLVEAYLHLKGHNVVPKGSVIGEDKTRIGNPDLFAIEDNNKYTFGECTVTKNTTKKKDNLKNKLLSDANDILAEIQNNKLKKSQISKIIFSFNSKINISDIEAVKQKLKGYKVDFYHLNYLSQEINLYGILAKEFLGLEFDTNQIQDINTFIKDNEDKSTSTSLQNKFLYRESEINDIKNQLDFDNVVLLTGDAGVGKSRLALEIAKNFIDRNKSYIGYIVSDKTGADIMEDLNYYFIPGNDYIVIIDDANRLNTNANFQKAVYKLKKTGVSTKILITVRSYAIQQVRDKLLEIGISCNEITINTFNDKEIEEIIKKEYTFNYKALERITDIAKGNVRLALMACKIAKETNQISKLYHVYDLYDSFYREKFKVVQQYNLLPVLFIVSYFRRLDKYNNKVELENILSLFSINNDKFWSDVKELHNLELVDVYEDKSAVRINEQNLMSYSFYKTFFDLELLPFENLLINVFEFQNIQYLKDILYPCLINYDKEKIINKIEPSVDKYLKSIKDNDEKYLEVLNFFYFIKSEEIIAFCWSKIKTLPVFNDIIEFDFYKTENAWDRHKNKYFESIKIFIQHQHYDYFDDAIEFLLELFVREPKYAYTYIKFIDENLTLEYDGFRNNFYYEKKFLELLEKKSSENHAYKLLFLAIAKNYLRMQYTNYKSKRGRTINILTFHLSKKNENIIEIRNKIWELTYSLFNSFPDECFKVLNDYVYNSFLGQKDSLEYAKNDSKYIMKIIESKLNLKNYNHCKLVNDYINRLQRFHHYSLPSKQSILNSFSSKTFEYSKLLTHNTFDSSYIFNGHRIYEDKKLLYKSIQSKLPKITITIFKDLLKSYLEIIASSKDGYTFIDHHLIHIIQYIVQNKKEKSFEYLVKLVEIIPINYCNYYPTLYEFLWKEYPTLNKQLYEYFSNNKIHTEHLFELLKVVTPEYATKKYFYVFIKALDNKPFYIYSPNFIDNYLHVEKDALLKLILKLESNKRRYNVDYNIHNLSFIEKYKPTIIENIDLFTKVFFYLLDNVKKNKNRYYQPDYVKCLRTLIEISPTFLSKWLKHNTKELFNGSYDFEETELDFSFFWELENHEKHINELTAYFFSKKMKSSFHKSPLYLLIHRNNNILDENKREQFLKKLINKYFIESNALRIIFNTIIEHYKSNEKTIFYLNYLFTLNNDVEILRNLDFSMNCSGSRDGSTQSYLGTLNFWIGLLSHIPNGLRFAEHRTYINSEKEYINRIIKSDEKRDFLMD